VLNLFTIGYEKAKPEAVLDELAHAKVKILVDTRAVAASLDERGIAYLHLQKLGTPAGGREAARAGDLKTLWRIYAKHLKTPQAIEAMDELVALVESKKPICLLCYERDPGHCHRSRIAEIMHERTGARVTDLIPKIFDEK